MARGPIIIILPLCLIFTSIALCLYAQGQAEGEDEQTQSFTSKSEEFIWMGWDFPLGRNVREITANLGKPARITTKDIKNRHDPKQTDTVSHLFYRGLEAATYLAGYNRREFIILVVIKDKRYKAKFNIGIGSTKDDIIKVLGKPSKLKKDLLAYEDESGYAEVNFYLKGDTAVKIEWRVFPD